MTVYCDYCDEEQDGVETNNGAIACGNCGNILLTDFLVEEPVFSKGPGGQSTLQGTLVRNYQSESVTYNKGADVIRMLICSLRIDDSVEEKAILFFQFAASEKFTRRYKIDYVATACLYVVCRKNNKPHLLIEFSAALSVSVYEIGAVYLQLYQFLRLHERVEFVQPLDPSIFIRRFTEELVDKMDEETMRNHSREETYNKIEKTATLILTSMKRDWMQTGRKPSGLCGAAIYISALAHRIRFPKSDVMTVFHVCEATLMKRLTEFGNTESGGLTIFKLEEREKDLEQLDGVTNITEFEESEEDMEEDIEIEQPDEGTNESPKTKVLCKHKGLEVHAHGLCNKCYVKFFKISGGLGGGADPPCFQRPQSEEAAEQIPEHQSTYNNSVNFTELEDLSGYDSQCLSDIEDAQIDFYLNNPKEVELKEIIWCKMNKEYLEEQALKDAMKAAEAADETGSTQKKRKRQQKPSDAKNASPARTATEATIRMLNKKGISNINPDALKSLFNEYNEELASGVTVEGVDWNAGQEEVDIANNFDDLNQVYDEHEGYDPNMYYNNDQVDDSYYGNENANYVDGEDENIDYGDDGDY